MTKTRKKVISKRHPDYAPKLATFPRATQERATRLFKRFKENPDDPMLETQVMKHTNGLVRANSREVKIDYRHRALYCIDNGKDGTGPEQYFWYWCGTREEFTRLTC